MARRRTLVVGDVHGCREELEALLRAAGFKAGKDRLVFCGDLIDRGPDPHGVVKLARELEADMVLGNHEEKHLRYREHAARQQVDPSYKIPMWKPHPETHDALTEADWDYLADAPLTVEVGCNTVVVHGGFSKDCPRWRPQKQSCRVRYVDAQTRKMARSSDGFTQPGAPGETVFWTSKYLGTMNVVYGHHSYLSPEKRVRPNGVWTLGIDTGCVFGNKLTGYWVETQKLVSVPSLRKWSSDISEPVRPAQPKPRSSWDWDWGRTTE